MHETASRSQPPPQGPAPLDKERPIYAQLAEDLVRRAARGELAPGDKVPSAREFAAAHMVNPNTVARAYQELEREGFLVTRRGLGSFITEDAARIQSAKAGLVEGAVARAVAELRALALSDADIQAAFLDKLAERETT